MHINTIEDKKEYTVITEDNPICYYYMLYDKNLIMYFIEDTSGIYTTLTLRTYEIATKRTTDYNDIDVTNFSRIKDITMSPLVNIIYINVETKTGVFGADMKVNLVNDGPYTLVLDSDELGF